MLSKRSTDTTVNPRHTSPRTRRFDYPTPALAVDGLVVKHGKILLVKRGNPPFRDCWALPGGFVEIGETTESAVSREVKEETALVASPRSVVGIYSSPSRDPRGHVVSIVYEMVAQSERVQGGSDARKAEWWDLSELPKLAFDHKRIIRDWMRR